MSEICRLSATRLGPFSSESKSKGPSPQGVTKLFFQTLGKEAAVSRSETVVCLSRKNSEFLRTAVEEDENSNQTLLKQLLDNVQNEEPHALLPENADGLKSLFEALLVPEDFETYQSSSPRNKIAHLQGVMQDLDEHVATLSTNAEQALAQASTISAFFPEEIQTMVSTYCEKASSLIKSYQETVENAMNGSLEEFIQQSKRLAKGLKLIEDALQATLNRTRELEKRRADLINLLPLEKTLPSENITEIDSYLKRLAEMNSYACIPENHPVLRKHPELKNLVDIYNAKAMVAFEHWRSAQQAQEGQRNTIEAIQKVTKRGLLKPIAFIRSNLLGVGSYTMAYKVCVLKPDSSQLTGRIEKERALGIANPNNPNKEEIETGFLQAYQVSKILRKKQARHFLFTHKVSLCSHMDPEASAIYMRLGHKGTLQQYLASNTLPLQEKMNLALQLAEALYDMHREPCPLCHNDLKPENILLTINQEGNPTLLLGDLGGAGPPGELGAYTHCSPELFQSLCGSEAQQGYPPNDMYVFGSLLAMFKHGQNPLEAMKPELREAIRLSRLPETSPSQREAIQKEIQEKFKKIHDELVQKATQSNDPLDRLIADLMNPDATKRPDAALTLEKLTTLGNE